MNLRNYKDQGLIVIAIGIAFAFGGYFGFLSLINTDYGGNPSNWCAGDLVSTISISSGTLTETFTCPKFTNNEFLGYSDMQGAIASVISLGAAQVQYTTYTVSRPLPIFSSPGPYYSSLYNGGAMFNGQWTYNGWSCTSKAEDGAIPGFGSAPSGGVMNEALFGCTKTVSTTLNIPSTQKESPLLVTVADTFRGNLASDSLTISNPNNVSLSTPVTPPAPPAVPPKNHVIPQNQPNSVFILVGIALIAVGLLWRRGWFK